MKRKKGLDSSQFIRREGFLSLLFWLCCCLQGLWVSPLWAVTAINNVRFSSSADGMRIVLDMSAPAEHKLFLLKSPDRLVVDLKNAHMQKAVEDIKWQGAQAKGIRTAKKNIQDLRIVVDLDSAMQANSFLLPKNTTYGDRLVIDLRRSKEPAKPENKTEKPAVVENRRTERRDIIIAIDAGHGGDDPGAVGVNRMHEKKVVFSIAKLLESLFWKEKGYKPVLIRTGDYYIPLADRRAMAREKNADMFISIHADSFTNKSANGASVYTLSSKGASSASAKFLAERENQSDLVGGVSLSGKDDVLSSVLVDLSMTYKMESSYEVAEAVLERLGAVTKLHGNRVEKAAFAVLKTPDIPSILVEAGFMSNPAEAKKLVTRKFQRKIAKAIFHGVDDYFKEKGIEGTYIASTFRHNRAILYVVERGDTLSQIALRYDVPVRHLMQFNSLESKVLSIGQTLKIPESN